MKKYINRFRIYDFGYRNFLVLCCIVLGIVQLQAQPVCYDYNASGDRTVRRDCTPPVTCNCPAGTLKYAIGEDEQSSQSLTETGIYAASTTNLTGGCITVYGLLSLNVNYVFTNVEFMMQPGAEIVLGGQITFDNCYFHSCEKMWKGIVVGNPTVVSTSGSINMINGTKVEDAFKGVTLGKDNGGTIENSIFNKNYYGIFMESEGQYSAISTYINGNTFKCDANLLDKWDGYSWGYNAKTKVGIYAISASFILGDFFGGNNLNTFEGIENAIWTVNSSALINRPKIQNMVNAYGTYSTINPYPAYAWATDLGILCRNSSLALYGANISGVSRALDLKDMNNFGMSQSIITSDLIGVYSSNHLASTTFDISDNNSIKANLIGLRIADSKNARVKIFNKNTFEVTAKPSSYSNQQGYAIQITDMATPSTLHKKIIDDNTFIFEKDFHGISLNKDGRYAIQKNRFTMNNTGASNLNDAKGIALNSSTDNSLISNDLATNINSTLPSSYSAIGIFNDNSPNSMYCCNKTNRSKYGIYFMGTDPNTKMKYNEMQNNSSYGLFISAGTSIGHQTNHWNKWTGTYTSVIKPAKNDNAALLSASKFEISKALGTLPWFPSTIEPATGWFSALANSTAEECQTTGDCATVSPTQEFASSGEIELAAAYASNQYQSAAFGEYVTWSGRRWVLEEIDSNPNWLNNTTLNTFKINTVNSNISRLNKIDKLIGLLDVPSAKQAQIIEVITTTIQSNNTKLIANDVYFATHRTKADSTKYYADRRAFLGEQSEMMSRMSEVYRLMKQDRSFKLQETLELNESLVPENVYEENEKVINRIYLNTIARQDSLNIEDETIITEIASQCPMIAGSAVFKARHLYSYFAVPSFDDTKICYPTSGIGINGKIVKNNTVAGVTMYPNPSSDEVYFSTTSTEPVQLILIDITGRVVAEQAFTSTTQISTRNLPNGQYFCQIWKGNQKVDTQKLSVIH